MQTRSCDEISVLPSVCLQWRNNRPCRPCNAGGPARVGGPCANPPKLLARHSCRLCIVVYCCILSAKLWLVIRCHVLVWMTKHLGKWRKTLLRYCSLPWTVELAAMLPCQSRSWTPWFGSAVLRSSSVSSANLSKWRIRFFFSTRSPGTWDQHPKDGRFFLLHLWRL